MTIIRNPLMALALLAGLAAARAGDPPAKAPLPPPAYTITVPGMHCAGCAKKLVDKLAELKYVARAEAFMDTKTIKVTPKPNLAVSPKELWETLEKGDQIPTKLETPTGTAYTAKPKT
ncbi:MAG: heavy metal-associated domain-containing protein [Gemmataceae bacterium]